MKKNALGLSTGVVTD